MGYKTTKVINQLIEKGLEQHFQSQVEPKKHRQFFPCITVSRETGSGGRLIARRVARELKMKFIDKELVELISRNCKRRKSLIESLDEKTRDLIEEIINSLAPNKEKLSDRSYLRYLSETILFLTRTEKAVILGRGANFIVPPTRCLRVRVGAPFRQRIANSMKFEKKRLRDALKEVKRIDEQRRGFIKNYFFKDDRDADYYDLVINTKNISLAQAVLIIIKAYKEKFG